MAYWLAASHNGSALESQRPFDGTNEIGNNHALIISWFKSLSQKIKSWLLFLDSHQLKRQFAKRDEASWIVCVVIC